MADLRASALIEIEGEELVILLAGAYYPGEDMPIHPASERPNDPEAIEWWIVSVASVAGGSEPCPALLDRMLTQSSSFDEKACAAIREEWFGRQDEAAERKAEARREAREMEQSHG